MRRLIIILFLSVIIQSCATYKTINPYSQKELIQCVDSLDCEKCVSIPRVYSGVAYTYCVMLGYTKLKSSHTDVVSIPLDILADTVLLPYTVIRQITDGNILLKKECKNNFD